MGIADTIREQYPAFSYLMNDPEVGRLLRQAVDPFQPFSPQRFQAKFYQTKYFRTRSANARNWEALNKMDPATAHERARQFHFELINVARQLGVKMTGPEIRYFTQVAMSGGMSASDPMMIWHLTNLRRKKPGAQGPGAIRTAVYDNIAIARDEYLYPLSLKSAQEWGYWIATGQKTQDDLRQVLAERAIQMYPQISEDIRRGQTPGQVFMGYRELIADEMELPSVNDVNLMAKDWNKIVQPITLKDGTKRMMNMNEAQNYVRQKPAWWSTAKGKQADTEMGASLLRIFGKKK